MAKAKKNRDGVEAVKGKEGQGRRGDWRERHGEGGRDGLSDGDGKKTQRA